MSNDESSNEETNVKNEGTSADDMKDVEDSKSDDAEKDVKEDSDGDTEMKGESSEEKEDEVEKKKKEEELRKKFADWPLKGIKEPHEHDVMYGRGGGTNHHTGNKRYRQLVEDRKLEYVNSKRLDKPLVALEIIRNWRGQIPPGRFLKMDEKTGTWLDVGDKKAREKTSQALREKAPLIRKQQEEEEEEKHKEEESKTPEVPKASNQGNDTKSTRFAEGTKQESSQVKKAVLARDHSLGREYLQAGEQVSLEGFSWQDPFQSNNSKKKKPYTSSHPSPPPPPPHEAAACPPAGRNSSHGSLGMAPPHHTSVGGPPPPPDYWGRVPSEDRQRQYSNSRIESWGAPYPYPPPPPPGIQGAMHQRSGSWTQPPPPPRTHGPRHQRSGSWSSGRDHSLSCNPLHNASITQPADQRAFDSSRSSSGYWGEPIPPPPPPPPGPYGSAQRLSNGSMGSYRQSSSPSHSFSPANSTPSPKPSYSVDLSIAKTWSGGEVRRTWSGEEPHEVRQAWSNEYEYDGQPIPVPGADASPFRAGTSSTVPRPHIVKRDTSNQNENYETKPSVKRAALNRDNSLASNRLKNQYMPEYYNFDTEHEMKRLSNNLEHSTLSSGKSPKPKTLGEDGRVSTIDAIAMDLMEKPQRLLEFDRVSTLDALDIDFDDDPIIRRDEMTRDQSKEDEMNKDLPKPKSLTPDNRLTTQDFLDLVSAPIVEDEDDRPVSKSDEGSEDYPVPLNEEKIAEEWLTQV